MTALCLIEDNHLKTCHPGFELSWLKMSSGRLCDVTSRLKKCGLLLCFSSRCRSISSRVIGPSEIVVEIGVIVWLDDDKEARDVAVQQMTKLTNHLKKHKRKNKQGSYIYWLLFYEVMRFSISISVLILHFKTSIKKLSRCHYHIMPRA